MTRPPSDQSTSGEPAAHEPGPDPVRPAEQGKVSSPGAPQRGPAAGDEGWDDERRDTGPVPVVPPGPAPSGGQSAPQHPHGSRPPFPAGATPGGLPPAGPGHAAPPTGGFGAVGPGSTPFPTPGAAAPGLFGGSPAGTDPGRAYGVGTYGPTPQAARRAGIGTPGALSAVVALLGLINLIAGFLPEVSLPASARQVVQSTSVFAVGPGWVPLLLLIGGLLAAAAFLPGGGDHRYASAAVSVAGAVGAVVALGVPNGFEELLGSSLGNGAGALLLFIGGTIQAVVAVAALVLTPQRPTAGIVGPGPAGPGRGTGAAGPGPFAAGPWSSDPSRSGAPQPSAGPGPGSWSPSPTPTPAAGWATPPVTGPPDDQRETGPIPVVRADGPSAGPTATPPGRHWARPEDATVSTPAQDRPAGDGDGQDRR